MGAVRRLVDELRRRGVTVHEWPGWDGRGNSDGGTGPRITQIEPVGAVIHHTATAYGSAYAGLVSSTRQDLLGGCLCNFAGNEDGSLTVIASGLAWHAGPGVGPSLGRVLSKIPNIRNRMNRLTVGLEIVYPGASPMRDAQYRTACVFARTVADLFAGGDIECVRAHAETNGNAPGGSGKWDPGYAPGKTIDMAGVRRDARNLEDDMQPADRITDPLFNGSIRVSEALFSAVMSARKIDQLVTTVTALTETVRAMAASRGDLDADTLLAGVEAIVQRNRATLNVAVSPAT